MAANDEFDPSLEIKMDKSTGHMEQQDSTVLANFVAEEETAGKLNLECIISFESFRSLQRLLRATAYVFAVCV